MTTKSKDPRNQLNSFVQLLIDDLLNTPDAELLQEASNDKSLVQAGVNAKKVIKMRFNLQGQKDLRTLWEMGLLRACFKDLLFLQSRLVYEKHLILDPGATTFQ